MATIKDIARIAGVSYGTVSNVLNGRGNVSAKKIKLVEEAAQRLGYQPNAQAKILKEGFAKTVSIILPNIISEQYSELYESLFSALNREGFELSLYLTHDSQETELTLLQQIATKRDFAVISVSSLDSANEYYQALKLEKENIIFVYRLLDGAEKFVTLDFEQAGQDIASAIINKQYRKIGLFTNFAKHNSYCLKEGLLKQFKQEQYAIELYHVESTSIDNTYSLAFDFANQQDDKQLDVIITTDFQRAHYLRNAYYLGTLAECPEIYALTNSDFCYEHNIKPYCMNYGMLSQQIVEQLLKGKQEGGNFKNKGFVFESLILPKSSKKHISAINLLTLPSPSTKALKKLLPHFKKESGIDVHLIVKPFNEIYPILDNLSENSGIDIIRIDMASLPWFAEKSLKPLSILNFDLEKTLSHYSPYLVERYSYVNKEVYGIPFDPSVQMMFYRKDVFNDPLIKRLYYEKYREKFVVPTSFQQFNRACEFLNQYVYESKQIQYGSSVTLGNPEIVASEFLLRYYANQGELVSDSAIKLNEEVALKTFNEFADFISIAYQLEASWWEDSVKQFEQGKVAMLIVYMNLFSHLSNKNILPLIGYENVPGSRPLLGGGSLGMSKYSTKNDEVSAFFNWIFSKEISEQIVLLGGITARDNIFENPKVLSKNPWLNAVKDNYHQGLRDNHLSNGQCINLRLVEIIIGQYVQDWVQKKRTTEQTIIQINSELFNRRKELI